MALKVKSFGSQAAVPLPSTCSCSCACFSACNMQICSSPRGDAYTKSSANSAISSAMFSGISGGNLNQPGSGGGLA